MAPFRLNRDDVEHPLPWRLMQNGPITLDWRREIFDEDERELRDLGFSVPRFGCTSWATEDDLHDALRIGLGMPDHTGRNFAALADSLADINVPEYSGMFVALDGLSHVTRSEVLLDVLADASRRWLLFGRIFGVIARTDDATYEPPGVGATRPQWNGREWLRESRG